VVSEAAGSRIVGLAKGAREVAAAMDLGVEVLQPALSVLYMHVRLRKVYHFQVVLVLEPLFAAFAIGLVLILLPHVLIRSCWIIIW
jgi:hypothetical protein